MADTRAAPMHYADGLRHVAARVLDGMPLRSVWPALHGTCYPVDDGYADRVGEIFGALRAHTRASRTYLGDVLRSWGDTPETMAALLESAAEEVPPWPR